MSALTAKYRDFVHLTQFITQLWMYATPVVYPLSLVLAKLPNNMRWFAAVNPMSGIVEMYRFAFLGAGTSDLRFLGVSAVATVLLLVSGVMIFSKTERTFIDTV